MTETNKSKRTITVRIITEPDKPKTFEFTDIHDLYPQIGNHWNYRTEYDSERKNWPPDNQYTYVEYIGQELEIFEFSLDNGKTWIKIDNVPHESIPGTLNETENK